jgi:hypothetical protein
MPTRPQSGQSAPRSRDQSRQPAGSSPADGSAGAVRSTLANLDQRKVAVHILTQGRAELMIGVGEYAVDPDLGGVLKIESPNEADPFQLLFVENEWRGRIGRGHALGCDFLIRLS